MTPRRTRPWPQDVMPRAVPSQHNIMCMLPLSNEAPVACARGIVVACRLGNGPLLARNGCLDTKRKHKGYSSITGLPGPGDVQRQVHTCVRMLALSEVACGRCGSCGAARSAAARAGQKLCISDTLSCATILPCARAPEAPISCSAKPLMPSSIEPSS